MGSVIVQLVHGDGVERGPAVHLDPGEVVSFGRGSLDRPVRLVLSHPEVPRIAGQITAVGDHWAVSNFSRDRTYVVDNPEGGGEHIKVAPYRRNAPIPFELARIVLPVTAGQVAELLVFAPEHTYAAAGDPAASGELTAATFALDQTAKYFLILLALCEPRLRDSSSAALPTVAEVIERLRPMPSCGHLTRSAVNFHIDYLAATKLRLREYVDSRHADRLEYKRGALVAFALRFDLVRAEHLALLPPRRRSSDG